ncbi:MAG: sulfite exporter TauE/SafE family protein [Flavobacteriaceae bacterium]|nr:sulfite exporter TauE/SafE family protein [Flavobacteriaceae bacterium]
MTVTLVLTLVVIGLIAGFLSGLIGIGGGIIMVPLFVILLGYSQYQAQGMSLAVMLPPVTFLAVYNYYQAGAIDWRFAIIVSAVFIVGGFIGSKVALSIDQQMLRKIFGGILLLIAAKLILGK